MAIADKKTQAPSYSRIRFVIEFADKGSCEGELVRHLAPFTILKITKLQSFQGLLTEDKDSIVLLINISTGLEKPKKMFREGDLGYFPINDSLHIFRNDAVLSRPMNHLGYVKSNLELLRSVRAGDSAKIAILM
ncbi:MAG: hypothetical protein QXT39_07065 [Conexivisphaerales archaeon]